MLKAMERALHTINAPISRWTANLAGFMLLVMTVIVLIQVAFRYVLNTPLSWTDESSRFLMIYMTYLCLPLIYLNDRNIAMSFVTDKLKGTRVYELLMIIAHVAALVLFAVWIYFGYTFFKTGSVMADSLPIPMYMVYAIPPVMLFISCFSALEKLCGSLHKLIHFNAVKQELKAAQAAE
ncbi:TRAP transporter small permease [Alginatibacterium sediminis]|uniref:TRAP transporter small permease protein n=1 Tax=Alginatibacterium sediminis TaxID=2164068 RepID=A0A420EJR3_9ALTE|nr:TRAP transporter small permease [Alginatibacterium sediminis]RKF20898.1 TRAP transporter small permease [Alginatibacterium sediminis]